MRRIQKPRPGEFPPYAAMYIDLLADDGRVLEHMAANLRAATELVAGMQDDVLLRRYAPGKWTIKETLAHVVDDERIYACRALRFARGDATELPGFEQDGYAAASGANERDARGIMAEYAAVRASTIALFEGLPEGAFGRSGVANGAPVTVRALAYHIAGHELHHLNLIRDRYLRAG